LAALEIGIHCLKLLVPRRGLAAVELERVENPERQTLS